MNERDEELGIMPKMEAHIKGELHRAFSIFIFNEKKEMLLQQRAVEKYHSGGLWTNACCSHPRPGEENQDAANRRLYEELGFTTTLQKIFDFTYYASFDNGLIEHEFDHVFIGFYDGKIVLDSDEVKNYSYQSMEEIEASITQAPKKYTAWFCIAFPKIKEWFASQNVES